jgi:hypothetical protein
VLPAAALAQDAPPAPAPTDAAAPADPAPEPLDNTGQLGIGYQVSLGGARGLSVRFGAGPVVLSAMFALRLISPDAEEEETRLGVEVAGGVAVPIQRWNGTHFGLGLRAALATQHARNHGDDAATRPYLDPFGLAFELPLYVEAWLSKRITALVEMGVVLNVVGDDGSPLNERPAGLGLGIGSGGLFGSAAVHYYFF